jgi:hypothetical protein
MLKAALNTSVEVSVVRGSCEVNERRQRVLPLSNFHYGCLSEGRRSRIPSIALLGNIHPHIFCTLAHAGPRRLC